MRRHASEFELLSQRLRRGRYSRAVRLPREIFPPSSRSTALMSYKAVVLPRILHHSLPHSHFTTHQYVNSLFITAHCKLKPRLPSTHSFTISSSKNQSSKKSYDAVNHRPNQSDTPPTEQADAIQDSSCPPHSQVWLEGRPP